METKPANWIAFFRRNGEEVSLQFYFAGSPSLPNVVSKIRKVPQLVEYVLPYLPANTSAETRAKAFLELNGIEGLVFTPFLNSASSLRS